MHKRFKALRWAVIVPEHPKSLVEEVAALMQRQWQFQLTDRPVLVYLWKDMSRYISSK